MSRKKKNTICIVCRKPLTNIDEYQPQNGTHFHSYGHYGSAVTDHFGAVRFDICVCDHCMNIALDDKTAYAVTVSINKEVKF